VCVCVCVLALKSDIWWHRIYYFTWVSITDHSVCQILGPAAAGSAGPVPTPVRRGGQFFYRGQAPCPSPRWRRGCVFIKLIITIWWRVYIFDKYCKKFHHKMWSRTSMVREVEKIDSSSALKDTPAVLIFCSCLSRLLPLHIMWTRLCYKFDKKKSLQMCSKQKCNWNVLKMHTSLVFKMWEVNSVLCSLLVRRVAASKVTERKYYYLTHCYAKYKMRPSTIDKCKKKVNSLNMVLEAKSHV